MQSAQLSKVMIKSVRILSYLAGLALAFQLVGCASIIDGNTKKLSIKTDPSGAKVTIYDLKRPVYDKITPKVAVMQTPCIIPLRTGGHYQTARYFVTLEKPGHHPLGFEVHSTINGWYFGNLHPLALPPLSIPFGMGLIDPMTGAMWTLEPTKPEHVYEVEDISKIPEDNVDAPIIRLPSDLE